MNRKPAGITLRPHHLLCIPHFTGQGYDAAFTANMTVVTGLLNAHPETPVTLTAQCDDLCAACPHSSGGVCASQEKVSAFDRAVRSACGFSEGQTCSWQALSDTVRSRIFQAGTFPEICASCDWYALCRRIHIEKEFSK